MITKALVCYAVSVLIPLLVFAGLFVFLKKKNIKLSALHIFIGALCFVLMLTLMFLLLLFAFSESSNAYMSALMPEGIYKIIIAVLFFFAVCVLRYFIINKEYYSNNNAIGGNSFLIGYGSAGSALLILYCLFNIFYISYAEIVSDFEYLTDQSVLTFKDGTCISVFSPIKMHIVFSVIFTLFAVFMLINAYFLYCRSTLPYKKLKTFAVFMIISAFEIIIECVLLFAVTKISLVLILIIAAVLTVLSALVLKYLYKYNEELPYNKQFE